MTRLLSSATCWASVERRRCSRRSASRSSLSACRSRKMMSRSSSRRCRSSSKRCASNSATRLRSLSRRSDSCPSASFRASRMSWSCSNSNLFLALCEPIGFLRQATPLRFQPFAIPGSTTRVLSQLPLAPPVNFIGIRPLRCQCRSLLRQFLSTQRQALSLLLLLPRALLQPLEDLAESALIPVEAALLRIEMSPGTVNELCETLAKSQGSMRGTGVHFFRSDTSGQGETAETFSEVTGHPSGERLSSGYIKERHNTAYMQHALDAT